MCSTKKFTWGAKKNLHPGYPNLLYTPPDCCRCAWKEGRIKKVSEKGNKGNGRTKRKYFYKESVSSTFYFKYLNSLVRHYIQTCAELKEKLVLFIIPTIKSLYTDFTSDSDFSGMLFVGKRLDRNNTLCLNRITIFQEINLNQINQICISNGYCAIYRGNVAAKNIYVLVSKSGYKCRLSGAVYECICQDIR